MDRCLQASETVIFFLKTVMGRVKPLAGSKIREWSTSFPCFDFGVLASFRFEGCEQVEFNPSRPFFLVSIEWLLVPGEAGVSGFFLFSAIGQKNRRVRQRRKSSGVSQVLGWLIFSGVFGWPREGRTG